MKHKQTFRTWVVCVPVILAIFYLAGCAAKTVNVWGDPQTGLILQYQMPEGQVLKYQGTSEVIETGEVMGQSIEAETKGKSAYSFKSKGQKENNHHLEVTINDMEINITSVQGELSPDMSSVRGKSFDMVLSPLGEEVDVSGAESIEYELAGSTRNLAAGFKMLFPDMAGRPVKIGDSWTSKFSVTDKTSSIEVLIDGESINTLEGFETVQGMECVRVESKNKGTMEGEGTQGGADLTFKGEFEGTDIWFFAYKEGIFVKMTSKSFVDLTVEITSPQSFTIPTTQERKSEVILVKK